MQSSSLVAGLESFVCAESGHRPSHGWRSLGLVQSLVQESYHVIRDCSRLLPALTGASDVLVAQQGHSSGKVVVLMLSLAQLANRLHLNTRAMQQQSARVAEPLNWANVAGKGVQLKAGWTTVTSGKKKPKKYPLDQRRVLFTRRSESSDLDPRDIMFEINKALAHARASVAVRLINLKYTEKGNLSGIVSENACADDLFGYAAIVMPTVQKLDHAVVDMEKTEKWRKLRVHGVALDRYLGEGGLDTAREEIEVMTGEQLPYAPRWIKGDTLGERFDNGSIKRSTLVLTVKSKKAATRLWRRACSSEAGATRRRDSGSEEKVGYARTAVAAITLASA